jgi:hypothetical protein
MNNLFATAKKVPAKTATAKKSVEAVTVTGLELFAEIDALEKTLEALKATARSVVVSEMVAYFAKNGPENFKGAEGFATGSLELRKRSTTSGLNEQEQLLLAAHKIPTQVVEDRAETYIVNPTYKDETLLLKKASATLSKIKDFPEDFFLYQESTKKTVVTENSITEVFKLNDLDTIKSLIPVVGTLAIKAKTTKALDKIIETVAAEIE